MCRAKIVNLVDEHDAPREKPQVSDLEASIGGLTPESSLRTTPTEVSQEPMVSSPSSVSPKRPAEREMKKWKPLPLPEANWYELPRLEAGYELGVYDAMLTSYYNVPSQNVVPTHGAIRYIEHYNEFGPYTRFRFQLCNNFQRGKCHKGAMCTYIHAVIACNEAQKIHLNNGTVYETLPSGAALYVYLPSAADKPDLVPSNKILWTKGAMDVYEAVVNGRSSVIQRPQHCAHFQYKKMCNRGPECCFVHSLLPPGSH